jgi:hypothetical protein
MSILCGTYLLDINVSKLALLPTSRYTTTVVNPLDESKLYRPQLGPLGQANLEVDTGTDNMSTHRSTTTPNSATTASVEMLNA